MIHRQVDSDTVSDDDDDPPRNQRFCLLTDRSRTQAEQSFANASMPPGRSPLLLNDFISFCHLTEALVLTWQGFSRQNDRPLLSTTLLSFDEDGAVLMQRLNDRLPY